MVWSNGDVGNVRTKSDYKDGLLAAFTAGQFNAAFFVEQLLRRL